MNRRINHLMLNVNRYDETRRFYGWLLPKVGYPNQTAFAEDAPKRGMDGTTTPAPFGCGRRRRGFRTEQFHRRRVGLCEIAFAAESRRQEDELAVEIEPHCGKVTDAPRQYDCLPRYYAVFFTDPDGLKLEVVHVP